MALQPSEGDIETVMVVTSISRLEAIHRLKNNNNNADQAIGEFFDDGESARKKYENIGWDDSHFGADREGGGNSVVGTQGVSFQVQGPDDYGPNGAPNRFKEALSRPPSRVTNRSPLGNVIDLTADSATDVGGSHPPMYYGADSQQEDDELERALAASREEAGLPPQPQQYGITKTTSTSTTVKVNEVHFGPATQTEYEREKWAMVPSVKINTQTVLPDPEASERKRDIDAPAFLKPSVNEHRLAGLLTMYHAIPMTRELFVDREMLAMTYGSDQDWWNGSSEIKLEPLGSDPSANSVGQVRLELQRLMAFLDKTDRSYGPVDTLATMGDVKRAQRNVPNCREVESAVLEVWRNDNQSRPSRVSKIFSHGVSSETRRDRDEEVFAILELNLPDKDSNLESIYDIADQMLWPNFGSSNPAESAYLQHVADVFVFKLSKVGSDAKALDIPVTWYPDRYMLENREAALEMRMAKKEAYEDILRLRSVEEKLTVFQTRNGKEFKIKELLETSMRHDEAMLEGEESEEDEHMVPSFGRSGKTAGLTAKLQLVMDSIDRKLQALKEEKEKTLETMRKLSQLYTAEDKTTDPKKLNKYLLRGVSTKNDVTYICRRAEPDLIEMDLDADAPKLPGDQWWRCAYFMEKGTPRISVEKWSEEEVLHAAQCEGDKQVLLMYASEAALQEEVLPLPTVLENFVKLDNQYFKRESPTSSDVTSPGKRKFDDSDDHESPTTRDSDREYRLNGETDLGWTGVQSASKEMNEKLHGGVVSTVEGKQQEMQQRAPGPLLSQAVTGGGDGGSLLDRMDVDDEKIVVDENVVDSSAAVKKVRSRS